MTSQAEDRNARLRQRLEVLKQELQAGHVVFASHLAANMTESLEAVRYRPDGEIDLDTVDGRVRALALAVSTTKARSEIKKQVSLAEIQREYFDWLNDNFGQIAEWSSRVGLNPDEAARAAMADSTFGAEISGVIPKFMEVLLEFWTNLGEAVHVHLEDAQQLKAIFGGDLFPSAHQNIASVCGLYVDTIVLPDPFLRSASLFGRWSPERRVYYFVKHALNILGYRELAIADVDPPVVVVAPDRSSIDADEESLMLAVSRADAVTHAGILFGRSFGDLDEAAAFMRSLRDVDAVAGALVRPDRLLFNVEWQGSAQAQIMRVLNEQPELGELVGDQPGAVVLTQAIGRMRQANDLLLRAQRLGGVPLIDASTSWRYLQWKLEYDATHFGGEGSRGSDLHVVRALQAAVSSGRASWLGRVPPAALIELRRQQAVEEIRRVLGDGVAGLSASRPKDFGQTAELVLANIEKMMADHEEQVRQVNAALRRFGFRDVGSWLVVGGVEVVAAATGMPLYGLAVLAGNQLLDVPKLKDFPGKIRELIEQDRKVRRSPVGLFFKCGE